MKPYIPVILLIVFCLLLAGCTLVFPGLPGEDRDSSSPKDGSTAEWTKDVIFTDEWSAEEELSEIEPVSLSVNAPEAERVPIILTLDEVEEDPEKSEKGLIETDTSYAYRAEDAGGQSLPGLDGELERFNEWARERAQKEREEGQARYQGYQASNLIEDSFIYLSSQISMRIGRSDTMAFSYIEEVYRYNREYEPDFYEVHGRTIDPVSGKELSLNDFFTSIDALPELIVERMGGGLPYGTKLNKDELVPLIRESLEGCRDDGSFAWMIHPATIEFDIVMAKEDRHYCTIVQIPWEALGDAVRKEAVSVGYDYFQRMLSSDIVIALGLEEGSIQTSIEDAVDDWQAYQTYYLGQKNGKRYAYGALEAGTTTFAVEGKKLVPIGTLVGRVFGDLDSKRFAEMPDPDHIPLGCEIDFEQLLGLVGEARIGDDGVLLLNGYLNVRGIAQPIMTAIEFEAEIFPDMESTESSMGKISQSEDLYIRRTDGETFVDAVIGGGPEVCRLYVEKSEEHGWLINGYPKDELVGYEGFPER